MKIKNNKLLIYVFIPVFLFLFGFFGSIIFNSISISTLIYPVSRDIIKTSPRDFMVKGDVIKGEFVAHDNNLGIFQIKFEKYKGINYNGNDRLDIKIEEKSSNFSYSATYPISEFEKTFVLPIGFPLQKNSKNKVYDFEIKSAAGKKTNSVVITPNGSVGALIYKYSKEDLVSSPKELLKFFVKKIYLQLTNVDFLSSSIVYYIPLFFYLLFVMLKQKFTVGRQFLAYISILLILIDSIFLIDYNSGILFLLLGFWIFNVVIYKFDYSVTTLLNVILMLTALVLMFHSPLDPILDKLSIYIFFLFIINLFQLILEVLKKQKNKISYLDVLRGFLNAKNK